jgi:hypothetical protein
LKDLGKGVVSIPEGVADILVARIKKLGRQIFLHIISGILIFFALYYIFDLFNNIARLTIAFISGILIWLPALGGIFERANIIGDLSGGEMYYTCGIKNTWGVRTLNGITYYPLVLSDEISECAYVLPCSRFLVPAKDKSVNFNKKNDIS